MPAPVGNPHEWIDQVIWQSLQQHSTPSPARMARARAALLAEADRRVGVALIASPLPLPPTPWAVRAWRSLRALAYSWFVNDRAYQRALTHAEQVRSTRRSTRMLYAEFAFSA